MSKISVISESLKKLKETLGDIEDCVKSPEGGAVSGFFNAARNTVEGDVINGLYKTEIEAPFDDRIEALLVTRGEHVFKEDGKVSVYSDNLSAVKDLGSRAVENNRQRLGMPEDPNKYAFGCDI